MKNFKWSEIELLNEEDQIDSKAKSIEEFVDSFSEVTYVEGYCVNCGETFRWVGQVEDFPDNPCKSCSKDDE